MTRPDSGFANREPLTRHQWARRSRRGLCMVHTTDASSLAGPRFCFVLFSAQDLGVVTRSHRRLPTESV